MPSSTQSQIHHDDEAEEPAFSVLPFRLKQRIDRAFDTATSHSEAGFARKKRKLNHGSSIPGGSVPAEPGGFFVDEVQPGGFVVDEPESAGGFLVEDADHPQSQASDSDRDSAAGDTLSHGGKSSIALSLIPAALQLLDLQPDDEDVLSVFRNAASGWTSNGHAASDEEAVQERYVSRKDWRAVCAALLDVGDVDMDIDDEDRNEELLHAEGIDVGEADDDDDGDDSSADEFRDSGEDSDTGDNSDDEYHEGGFANSKTKASSSRRGAALKAASSSADSQDEDDDELRVRRITPRQKQECRRAFGLFFPEVNDSDLDKQRIKISDISRVAKLLKEKLKAEEIIEMLEAFSTSPDKSMGLTDFERMMIAAKLA